MKPPRTLLYGAKGAERMLLLAQVVLRMPLSFAAFPLVEFTSNARQMGEWVNSRWLRGLSYGVALTIAGLNTWLLVPMVRGH